MTGPAYGEFKLQVHHNHNEVEQLQDAQGDPRQKNITAFNWRLTI